MTPRTGTCDRGMAPGSRRHANAEGVRDRHHTCEEPGEGKRSRTVLQQRRGGVDPIGAYCRLFPQRAPVMRPPVRWQVRRGRDL